MTNLQPISLPSDAIFIENNTVHTNSLKVSEAFSKRHGNVIRKLETLECSSEFSQLNFESAEYIDNQDKSRKMYNMTKDGFIFLVMGFTGKKAAAIKEAYINAFNKMYEALHNPTQTNADDRTGLRNAIQKISNKKHIAIPDAYNLVHQYMNVKHIGEIPKADIQTAVAYCHKVILEGELVEPEQLPAPKNTTVLSYPKPESSLKHLLYQEMHDCGWLIELPGFIHKLQQSKHQAFTVDDISGIENEVNSLMHLIEVQRHKLNQIHRISEY